MVIKIYIALSTTFMKSASRTTSKILARLGVSGAQMSIWAWQTPELAAWLGFQTSHKSQLFQGPEYCSSTSFKICLYIYMLRQLFSEYINMYLMPCDYSYSSSLVLPLRFVPSGPMLPEPIAAMPVRWASEPAAPGGII